MWTCGPMPGGWLIEDGRGRPVAYVYASTTPAEVASGRRLSPAEAEAVARQIVKAVNGRRRADGDSRRPCRHAVAEMAMTACRELEISALVAFLGSLSLFAEDDGVSPTEVSAQ